MAHSTMARQNVAGLHYVHTLASAYARFLWISDPDYATISDIEAWQKVRRDAIIAHAIERRQHAAAGLDWQLLPATDDEGDQRAAEVMTDLLRQMRGFHMGRFNLAESIFRGSSWAYINTRRRAMRVTGDKRRIWMVPERLTHVDRYRFRLSRTQDSFEVDAPAITTQWEMWSVKRQEWEPLLDRRPWVHVTFQPIEESLGYGRGLLNSIFFYWRAKEVVLTQGLAGLERWAQGLVHLALDDQRVGSVGRSNDEMVTEYLEQLKKHRSEHIFVTGKQDELKVHDAAGTGYQMVRDFLEYLDRGVTQLILSSILPTGGGADVGSNARAEIEQETSEAIFQSDRRTLSESIQDSLIDLIWRRNRGNLMALFADEGLPLPRCPEFVIMQKPLDSPENNIAVISQALQAGIPLKRIEIYERLGYSLPDENDDVIEGGGPEAQQGIAADPFGGGADPFAGLFGPEPETAPVEATAEVEGPQGTAEVEMESTEETVVGEEEIAAEGVEPPTMQELSLAYERAIKNGDRATANIMRKKLWAVVGEDTAPDITDEEWAEITGQAGEGEGEGGDPFGDLFSAYGKGQPCQPGETAKRDECIPRGRATKVAKEAGKEKPSIADRLKSIPAAIKEEASGLAKSMFGSQSFEQRRAEARFVALERMWTDGDPSESEVGDLVAALNQRITTRRQRLAS